RNLGDVLHLHRNAVGLGEHDVFDVVDAPALRQIAVAAAVEQADAADIDRLLPDGDLAAANIDVGISKCGYDLRNGKIVSIELIKIDVDTVLFRGAAPGVHRHDARHRVQAPCHDPILHGAQIG